MPAWAEKIVLEILKRFLLTPENVDLAKKAVVCWLASQVANTDNKIDDAVVAIVAEALGVDPATCPVA